MGTGVERVRIPAGSSARAIADTLAARRLVPHPLWFRLVVRAYGLDDRLKAGTYDLDRAVGARALAYQLAAGRGVEVKLTVREGWTSVEIAAEAERVLGTPRDAFLALVGDSLEGFLYPETYLLPIDATPAQVVRTLRDGFERAWDPSWDARLAALGLTRRQAVALASIVEGEAVVGDERPVIAGVYWNRLRRDMPLQADPTVQYAIVLATGQRRPRLFFRDYRIASPYNTYLIRGLPPSPVGSPSRASLEATLHPAAHDYLFFVAADDGRHVFTRTYAEHLRAVRQAQRGG